ncbi:unnamed protein product [Pleuronectes platessa]|uniref:Uncharacterized protein n=1 Tax=Pleuronectes platessa TaxID=8262 RepID=A0A9N7Y7M8_PLEPL|nr:unnamed protein product [Pleuronectes platessa]
MSPLLIITCSPRGDGDGGARPGSVGTVSPGRGWRALARKLTLAGEPGCLSPETVTGIILRKKQLETEFTLEGVQRQPKALVYKLLVEFEQQLIFKPPPPQLPSASNSNQQLHHSRVSCQSHIEVEPEVEQLQRQVLANMEDAASLTGRAVLSLSQLLENIWALLVDALQ